VRDVTIVAYRELGFGCRSIEPFAIDRRREKFRTASASDRGDDNWRTARRLRPTGDCLFLKTYFFFSSLSI
jgi:hypothetical protein